MLTTVNHQCAWRARLRRMAVLTLLCACANGVYLRPRTVLAQERPIEVDFTRRCVATQATFTPMNIEEFSGLTDLTADGRIAMGGADGSRPTERLFIWAKDIGTVDIGGLGNPRIARNASRIAANAINDDGVDTPAIWEGGESTPWFHCSVFIS